MTEKQAERSFQGECPVCGTRCEAFDSDRDGDYRHEFFECPGCGCEFTETYKYDHTYWME